MTPHIKTTLGKIYRLETTNNHRISKATAISPPQLADIFRQAKPQTPATWQGIWDSVKPVGAKVALKDADIIEAIRALIEKRVLTLSPEPLASKTGGSTGSPGGNSGGAPGGSGGGAELGVARGDKDASSQSPESLPQAHSETGATSSADAAEGGQDLANTCTDGDPVSMISGEEMLQLQDCHLPGPVPFTFSRTYRSGNRRDIGLGVAWSHSGSAYLEIGSSGLTLIDDEGRSIAFNLPSIHQRSKYLPEGLVLDRISDDVFVLKKDGQWDRVFTRSSPQASRCRLTQLRHPGYRPATHVLGARTPESGYCIRFHYNADGGLARIQGNWGKSLRLVRTPQGRIAEVQLSNDRLNKHKPVAHYDYSASGDLIAHRNAKHVGERYQYTQHLITKRSLNTGFSFHFEWDGDGPEARCIHNWGDRGIYEYYFDWDPATNTSKSTDSRGFQRSYHYNDYGQVIKEIDNEGGVHLKHYASGRLESATDPEGHTTEYFYDPHNKPAGLRDALGHHLTIDYFQGRPTAYIDKDKTQWRREYNRQGLLHKLIDPYQQATEYRYNPQGLITRATDPMQRSTVYRWSDDGELSMLIDPRGHARRFHYDDWGRLIATDFLVDGTTAVSTTRYQYNACDKIEKVIHPDGKTTSYTYNDADQLVRHSDPQGRTTEFTYDGLSQVIERTDAEGRRLKYQYDSERNLSALINENGEQHQFFYDGCERLIKEIGFDGRVQHYKYNRAGHLIKHMDAGTIVTEFERDALGRMLSKTSRALKKTDNKDGAAASPSINPESEKTRYQYDPKGRLLASYNRDQYLEFSYNRFGGLKTEHHSDLDASGQNRLKASMQDINYTHIWPGLQSSITLPDGQHIGYTYDQHGALNDIHHNGQGITHIERDRFGRETSRQQGSVLTASEYDPMGRLQKQSSINAASKAQGPVQREYAYDQFGNLSQLIDGNHETRFIYDLVNRLEQVESNDPNTQERFDFDPASNLVIMASGDAAEAHNSTSTSHGNRLSMQGDRHFTYDERGNLICEKRGKGGKLVTTFEYNLNNQLTSVTKDGQRTDYRYDPLGRRIEKRDTFGRTRYLWAGDQLVQEQRGEMKKTYIYEPESFKPVAMVQDGELYHYHLDHLGTPKELSNAQGKVVWKARYKAYGNLALKEVEEVENNLRFQGQYFDEETGLHYNRHRYYNPNTGQFTTQDPIGLLGGVNNYQYAANPIQWVDPFGLSCKEGTATIYKMGTGREMHFAIQIETKAGTKRATHQLGMTGSKTLMDTFDSSAKSDLETIKIKIPNAKAAIDYQDYLIGQADRQLSDASYQMENLNTPEYDIVNQSCLTHVFDVLREAGIEDAPKHSDPKDRETKKFMVGLKRRSKQDFSGGT